MTVTADRVARLRMLLQEEKYPLTYMHKFIGRNTPAFRAAVAQMVRGFPTASLSTMRESGESASWLAYTYVQVAQNADEVVAFVEATTTLPELRIIL